MSELVTTRVAPRIESVNPLEDTGAMPMLAYTEEEGGAVASSEVLKAVIYIHPSPAAKAMGLSFRNTPGNPRLPFSVNGVLADCNPIGFGKWSRATSKVWYIFTDGFDDDGDIALKAYRTAHYNMRPTKQLGEVGAELFNRARRACKSDGVEVFEPFLYNLAYMFVRAGSAREAASILASADDDVIGAFERAGRQLETGSSAKAMWEAARLG